MNQNLLDRHGVDLWSITSTKGTIYLVRTPATAPTAPGHGQNRARYLTMDDATERWLPVVGFEGFYEVSDVGRVRSLDRIISTRDGRRAFVRGKMRTTNGRAKSGGYPVVGLNKPGYQRTFNIHRLVCAAFNGPPPHEDSVIRHLNGNPLDNRPENLAWGTCAENSQDMVRHGRSFHANKTHCPHGHEYTPENTHRAKTGKGGLKRECRQCLRRVMQAKNEKRASRRRQEWPTLTCQVCESQFVNAIPKTRFCSEECRRISRRKEFGLDPTSRRQREARRRTQ